MSQPDARTLTDIPLAPGHYWAVVQDYLNEVTYLTVLPLPVNHR